MKLGRNNPEWRGVTELDVEELQRNLKPVAYDLLYSRLAYLGPKARKTVTEEVAADVIDLFIQEALEHAPVELQKEVDKGYEQWAERVERGFATVAEGLCIEGVGLGNVRCSGGSGEVRSGGTDQEGDRACEGGRSRSELDSTEDDLEDEDGCGEGERGDSTDESDDQGEGCGGESGEGCVEGFDPSEEST
jgi:hypothetical protein